MTLPSRAAPYPILDQESEVIESGPLAVTIAVTNTPLRGVTPGDEGNPKAQQTRGFLTPAYVSPSSPKQ